jgi:flagellar M-ring protein FliF
VFLLLVVSPVVKHMMKRDKEAAEAAATTLQLANAAALGLENAADGEGEPVKELSASESLEEMKAKMKQKKSNISAEMLDTANTYDDKVALIRMIVSDDSARVASVLKNMIRPG